MGDDFVRVENVLSCDVGDAVLEDEFDSGIALWKDVEAEIEVSIVIVPEGPSDRTATRGVGDCPGARRRGDQRARRRRLIAQDPTNRRGPASITPPRVEPM